MLSLQLHRRLQKFKETSASSHASSSPESHLASVVPPHFHSVNEASYNVTLEHLVPLRAFGVIIDDYVNLIYPVVLLLHLSSFQQRLSTQDYERDPLFLRLCLSICAYTVSSIPRKISAFSSGCYQDGRDFVSRAYLLVMASRFTSSPDWADSPSMDTLICSYLLACASHYTEKPSRAWMLMNESLQTCRNLKIWCREGYQGLSVIDAEICKRMF